MRCKSKESTKYDVRDYIKLNGNYIVVYNYSYLDDTTSPKIYENVECFDSQGEMLWRINSIDECETFDKKADTFTGIRFHDGKCLVNTWSCFRYLVNVENGNIKRFDFTK
jgi:hypothetical protein